MHPALAPASGSPGWGESLPLGPRWPIRRMLPRRSCGNSSRGCPRARCSRSPRGPWSRSSASPPASGAPCGSSSASTRRARHPPRAHRRAAQAPRLPGRRPHGRPDRRGLHGPRRRSQRALPAAPDAEPRGDRGERSHLSGAGPADPRAAPPRGPPQQRVARYADGRHARPGPHDDRRAGCSSATTSPTGAPPVSRSRCSS